MKNFVLQIIALTLCITAPVAQAADFDGSKTLICAPVEAMDCIPGDGCTKGTPDEIGAPAFMRIDFVKKAITGPKRTSPIQFMEKTPEQILLQGTELGNAWALALGADGKMTVSMADRNGAFVFFGSCTPL